MNKLFIACLSISLMLKGLLIAHSSSSLPMSPVIEERHELFMLSVLSYLYINLENHPKVGHDISALIAWDVENIESTPEFVIDCNRNFQKQGSIYHAEMITIEQALQKTQTIGDKELLDNSKGHFDKVKKRLGCTTLYSSLEPCPFCTMGISWAHIPKVIYFMDDPGMRDCETYSPIVSFPKEFYVGRQLTWMIPSSLPLTSEINRDLKELVLQNPISKYITISANGKKIVDLNRYLADKKIFKSAYDQFFAYQIKYHQNRELFKNLQSTVTKPISSFCY